MTNSDDGNGVEEFDFMIVGSSLSNALLSNILSWKGFRVLSVDENDYYGDYTAALNLNQVCDKYTDTIIKDDYIEQNKKNFGLDLIPSYMLCNSKMIKYIVNFNIYRYLEVVKLDSFFTFDTEKAEFYKLKTTKQEIFTDSSISPITKRTIMKCIKFLVEDVNEDNQIWNDYKNKPVMDLFKDKFSKLPLGLINEFVYTICNSFDISGLSTKESSNKITKFFQSYQVYGNFPALLTKYGGLGEIIQGIYRSSALINNIIRLGTKITRISGNTFELSNGEKATVKEKIIISNYQTQNLEALGRKRLTSDFDVYRSDLFVKKNSNFDFCCSDTNGSILTFPPKSFLNERQISNTVQLLVLSDSLERSPKGYVTLSIMATNQDDLNIALDKYASENDVSFRLNHKQNINYPEFDKNSTIIITPDVHEPLSLDLDEHVNVAIEIYGHLLGHEGENDFMSVSLPSTDE